MSKEENNTKSKNYTTNSNESNNKKDFAPTKTSQSFNTESYEYYNQKTTSKKNINDSPYYTLNQQSNSGYSSNKQNSNAKKISQNGIMQSRSQFGEENKNSSGLKCTCHQNNKIIKKKNLKNIFSPQNRKTLCTCGHFKRQLFEKERIGNNSMKDIYGYQFKKQQNNIYSSRYTSNNNINQKIYNLKKYNGNIDSGVFDGHKDISKTQINTNNKIISYISPNNPRLQISDKKDKNLNLNEYSNRIDTNNCTCPNHMDRNTDDKIIYNYSYYNSNEGNTEYSNNNTYKYKKNTNIYITNTNKSYSLDNKIIKRKNIYNQNIEWNKKCVGQNNESLQILAEEKPKLIAQSVQDMQVIQEPKPIQILLPMQPNEIDYTLGLEIYGKNSEEEKRALKEAEKIRKQMEICPENIENLNFKNAYPTIVPHFGELNIDKKEDFFWERKNFEEIQKQENLRKNKFEDLNMQEKERKAYSVEHSDFIINQERRNKIWEPFIIENEEMNIYGEKNFNKYNQKVITTKMNIRGIHKTNWNELNQAIKTTKMNIDGVIEPEEEIKEKEPEEEEQVEESIEEPVKEPVEEPEEEPEEEESEEEEEKEKEEIKKAKESKSGTKPQLVKGSKSDKEPKSVIESKEPKEVKEPKSNKEQKPSTEKKEPKEQKQGKGPGETKELKSIKDQKQVKEPKKINEPKQVKGKEPVKEPKQVLGKEPVKGPKQVLGKEPDKESRLIKKQENIKEQTKIRELNQIKEQKPVNYSKQDNKIESIKNKNTKKASKTTSKKKTAKKVIKKVVKKIVKKQPEKQENIDEDISETDNQNQKLDVENFDLNIIKSRRRFGDKLIIQNETYKYKGTKKPEEVEKPLKNKYKEDEVLLDSNNIFSYEAEFPKVIDWNEDTFPMSGRPFTIEKKPRPTLYASNSAIITIKQSYKEKDWNKMVKVRRDANINMPHRKTRKPALLRQRVQPVILKGKGVDWNKVNKKENDYKLQISKSAKGNNFVLSKENEVYIENEAEEILINDDYNIVEENYSRPIRANIKKIPDYTEESISSEYDILQKVRKHEGQFNQFKELVKESIKINGQKVIINDISGKYPRRVETFEGLEENYQKFVNDQNIARKRFNKIHFNVTKTINRTIEQSGVSQGNNGEINYYGQKIVQKQINNEPIQQNVYYLDSKTGGVIGQDSKHRITTYELEHEELDSKDSRNRGEIIELERGMKKMSDMRNMSEGNYYYREMASSTDRRIRDSGQEDGYVQRKNIEQIYYKQELNENQSHEKMGQHIKEKNENNQIQHEEEEEEEEEEVDQRLEKIEEVGENELEEKRQNSYKQEMNIDYNKEGSQIQSQKIQLNQKLNEKVIENNSNISNRSQQEEIQKRDIIQKEKDNQPRLYIKEITYSSNQNIGSPEENKTRHIALREKEYKQDIDSQLHDKQPQDVNSKEQQSKGKLQIKGQEMQLQSDIKYNEQKLRNEQQIKINQEQNIQGNEEIQVQENEIQDKENSQGQIIRKRYIEIQNQKISNQNINLETHIQEHREEYNQVEEQHIEQGQEEQENQKEEQMEQIERKRREAELEGEKQIINQKQMKENEQEKKKELEKENIQGKEQIPKDGEIKQQNMNRLQVTSVEEIPRDNMNFQNMNQAMKIQNQTKIQKIKENINNIQTSPKIISASGAGTQSPNGNNNQRTTNQTEIKTEVVQKQITKGNIVNQVNIQKQQKIIKGSLDGQTQIQLSTNYKGLIKEYPQHLIDEKIDNTNNMTKNIMLQPPQIISSDKQTNKNEVKSNISNRHNQAVGPIKYEQSRDPMMYSFGAISASSAGQNLGNSVNKNEIDIINNSDFLVSSIKNNNIKLGLQKGGIAFTQNSLGLNNNLLLSHSGGNILRNNLRIISGSNSMSNVTNRDSNRNIIPLIRNSSSNRFSSSKKEPADSDSKKKPGEEEVKISEISEFPLEPRDSRRKN